MPKVFQVFMSIPGGGDVEQGPLMTLADAVQLVHHLKIIHPRHPIFVLNDSHEIVYKLGESGTGMTQGER